MGIAIPESRSREKRMSQERRESKQWGEGYPVSLSFPPNAAECSVSRDVFTKEV